MKTAITAIQLYKVQNCCTIVCYCSQSKLTLKYHPYLDFFVWIKKHEITKTKVVLHAV